MYNRPKFLEELHAIREEMSRECDYDMDLFAVSVRHKSNPGKQSKLASFPSSKIPSKSNKNKSK